MNAIYLVGTADTKGKELAYLADSLSASGLRVVCVDVGTRHAPQHVAVDISAREVARHHPAGESAVLGPDDRGIAVAAMGDAFSRFIQSRDDVAAVLGIGGGGGTSIITTGMQALPLGLPKVMVSTLASGDTAPYVGVSDVIMMPSVTDMAGLNRLSRIILHNAAQAVIGMAGHPAPQDTGKPALGLTMFGVTTPCIMNMVELLHDDYDCMVFHATGTGGRSMENLISNDLLLGVLDITTTEVCDLLFGGVLPATEQRFQAGMRSGLPYVASLGACDMVNFWAPPTVPEAYRHRRFHSHNPNVTLMRTSADECRRIGRWIGERLALATGPMHLLIPEKGISALDIEGGAFHDPEADAALFQAAEQAIAQGGNPHCTVERLPLHINDPQFARHAVDTLIALIQRHPA